MFFYIYIEFIECWRAMFKGKNAHNVKKRFTDVQIDSCLNYIRSRFIYLTGLKTGVVLLLRQTPKPYVLPLPPR